MKATKVTIVGAVVALGAIAASVFHELTKEKVANVRLDLDWDDPDADKVTELPSNEQK